MLRLAYFVEKAVVLITSCKNQSVPNELGVLFNGGDRDAFGRIGKRGLGRTKEVNKGIQLAVHPRDTFRGNSIVVRFWYHCKAMQEMAFLHRGDLVQR